MRQQRLEVRIFFFKKENKTIEYYVVLSLKEKLKKNILFICQVKF